MGYQQYGIDSIPLELRHARTLGGGFHCVTLDLHRDGYLKSYFPYLDRKNQK